MNNISNDTLFDLVNSMIYFYYEKGQNANVLMDMDYDMVDLSEDDMDILMNDVEQNAIGANVEVIVC